MDSLTKLVSSSGHLRLRSEEVSGALIRSITPEVNE